MENVNIIKGVSKKGNDFYVIEIKVSDDYSIRKYLTTDEVMILKLKGIIK